MKKFCFISLICLALITLLVIIPSYNFVCNSNLIACKFNPIKKYNKELHTVFGDFRYEYLGKKDNHSYGFYRRKYKEWKIYFTDPYGKEKNAILVNDERFDTQIKDIYEKGIEIYLITETLNEYLAIDITKDQVYDDYDENTIDFLSNDCVHTKEYDYYVTFKINFNLDEYYDSYNYKIKNYNFFNLTDTNISELINQGYINISYINYIPTNKKVLSESEKKAQSNYLIEVTKKINSIIPVEKAYYQYEKNSVNYKGEDYITTGQDELNFK